MCGPRPLPYKALSMYNTMMYKSLIFLENEYPKPGDKSFGSRKLGFGFGFERHASRALAVEAVQAAQTVQPRTPRRPRRPSRPRRPRWPKRPRLPSEQGTDKGQRQETDTDREKTEGGI